MCLLRSSRDRHLLPSTQPGLPIQLSTVLQDVIVMHKELGIPRKASNNVIKELRNAGGTSLREKQHCIQQQGCTVTRSIQSGVCQPSRLQLQWRTTEATPVTSPPLAFLLNGHPLNHGDNDLSTIHAKSHSVYSSHITYGCRSRLKSPIPQPLHSWEIIA